MTGSGQSLPTNRSDVDEPDTASSAEPLNEPLSNPLSGAQQRWFKMTVGYDGTQYCGWQVQPNGVSIQSMLERAIAQVCRQRVRVTGSGRTDSGVHAIGQVASFAVDQLNWKATAVDLLRALNSKLPPDIAISELVDAPEGFHAIRDAVGKRYRYQLSIGPIRHPFEYRYRWQVPGPLDLEAMEHALVPLRGRHDFASFQAVGAERSSTVREIRDLVLIREASESSSSLLQRFSLEVEADGFLYNMVRNIVGTVMQVARGRYTPDWVADVLAAKDRKVAGPTAPPHGLFLMRVDYPAF